MPDDTPKKACPHFRVLSGACDDCGERIELTPEEREYLEQTHLTAKQLAGMVPLTEEAIVRYARAGIIPFLEIEGRILFKPRAIDKWIRTLLSPRPKSDLSDST